MHIHVYIYVYAFCRSQCPRSLRRRSAAPRLLRLCVRIPPGAWMFVCYECCVLSGRGLWDEPITRPEDFYRQWCVVVCDPENRMNEEAIALIGLQRHKKRNMYMYMHFILIFNITHLIPENGQY